MLNLVRDDFDANSDDILNTINKMLEKNRKNEEEKSEEAEKGEENKD